MKALAGYLPVDGGGAIEYVVDPQRRHDQRSERVPAGLGRARQRAELVPGRRQPGGARPPLTMRTKNTIPMTSLIVLAAMPAVAIGAVWQLAERNEVIGGGAPADHHHGCRRHPRRRSSRPTCCRRVVTRHHSPSRPPPARNRSAANGRARRPTSPAMMTDDDVRHAPSRRRGVPRRRGVIVALIPASNMKVLVAAVALDVLGPDFRFRTELRSVAPAGGDGARATCTSPAAATRCSSAPTYEDPLPATRRSTRPSSTPSPTSSSPSASPASRATSIGDGSRYDDEFRVPSWGEEITERRRRPLRRA